MSKRIFLTAFCVLFPSCPMLEKISTESVGRCDERKTARTEFFHAVMGVTEQEFWIDKKKALYVQISNPSKPHFTLINKKDGKRFSAGSFEEITLGELRKQAASKLKAQGVRAGKFSVIEAGYQAKLSDDLKRKLDIGALQADPANKDAVFAVASNFNALETLGATDNVSLKALTFNNGDYQSYLSDITQGPLASISAAPGLILRSYFLYYDKNANAETWRQREEHQINLLDELGVQVSNGYIVEDLKTLIPKISEENAHLFKIAFHSNIQVTNGFFDSPQNHDSFYDQSQIINQAFAAAFAIKYGFPYYEGLEAEAIAQKILRWTYEAILKAAYVKGKTKVYLPRIGGGVFNNKPSWIDDAILAQGDFIAESGMEVILNNFDLATKCSAEYPRSKQKMLHLVKRTGGDYLTYTK